MMVNINDQCRVKLRLRGHVIIESIRQEMRRFAPQVDWDKFMQPDAEGKITMTVWDMANTFGPSFGNGMDSPIDHDIEIILTGRGATPQNP